MEDRIGAGHAEGLFESWSNLYSRFAQAIEKASLGEGLENVWYPSVEHGAEGIRWIENCLKSAANSVWIDYN